MPAPEKFRETLVRFGVSEEVKERIYIGFEEIKDKSAKLQRAAFFGQAVSVMNESLTKEQVKDILEANACCKGGSRERNSRQFAKENKELGIQERLERIGEHPEWHMGRAEIDAEGYLIVHGVSYWLKEKFECACPNANQRKLADKVHYLPQRGLCLQDWNDTVVEYINAL